jgi:hypothetical protein
MNAISTRLHNHTELVYRPGGRELAIRVFEALGCRVVANPSPYLLVLVEPSERGPLDNVLYASECTPEQEALERALGTELARPGPLGDAFRAQQAMLRKVPQNSTHLGIRLPSVAALDAAIEKIEKVGAELGGRLGVSGVFRPGDPGSLAPNLVQAFVHTDIVAAGLVTLGQHFELQALV